MTVLRYFRDQPVAVLHDEFSVGFADNFILKGRFQFVYTADGFYDIKIKKDIRFRVIFDVVPDKNIPRSKVFVPISELHVKATIKRLVMHLGIKAFPVGHRTLPFFSYRLNRHVESSAFEYISRILKLRFYPIKLKGGI